MAHSYVHKKMQRFKPVYQLLVRQLRIDNNIHRIFKMALIKLLLTTSMTTPQFLDNK